MDMVEAYKPVITMIFVQSVYAALNLFSKAVFLQGLSPKVFVVYKHAIATLLMASLSFLSARVDVNCRIAVYQNAYFEGLNLASPTAAGAIPNITPAITFLLSAILRLEKVNIRSLRSIAKISGTILCISGAICMALLKGPELLNSELLLINPEGSNWVLGCLLLTGGCCFWSLWLIIQVPISVICHDHLYSTAWMCFLGTIECAAFTLFVEKDAAVWNLNSYLEMGVCLFGGVAVAVSFFLQTWCISKRGPLFSAMFNPLCTVIVAISSAIFLHEQTYLGSLIGALAVIIGLYVVLWGKAKDHEEIQKNMLVKQQNDESRIVRAIVDDSLQKKKNHNAELEELLLS
ncbi:WAT1-related protein At4g30420-like isoform X2 [Mercurialis annua]|uniref:WAT1-related protein At4g30420-like isoform X2 n=1 Tax=Mercurialis annua TaxID=3986 RepID=UPI002160802B|nr:WAT1-related protein At4g30420-like isoform X2 [Mercurialis annua]